MKDVDHFQTIEVRVTLSVTDISHLYFLLARAECQDDWNECIFDFRNRRLLAEFADALDELFFVFVLQHRLVLLFGKLIFEYKL